jgi:hypothetical protein
MSFLDCLRAGIVECAHTIARDYPLTIVWLLSVTWMTFVVAVAVSWRQ